MGRMKWTDEKKVRYPKKYAAYLSRGWTPEELETGLRNHDPKSEPAAKREFRKHYLRAATRRHRLKTYGLTNELMEAMLIRQGNSCAICHKDFYDGVFVVDHCHIRGHVRGLLCYRCNSAIARFSDRPELLESAARYLRAVPL